MVDTASKIAVVIRHLDIAHLGNFEPVLVSHGYEVRYLEATEMHTSDAAEAACSADLLVVLGGDMGVYERDEHAFIDHELAALAARLEAEQPTLGVCLGAQMMAEALGGRVSPGKSRMIGFSTVQLTDAGRDSPLRHFDGLPIMQWHGDSFRLPGGATRLASSAEYSNEAYRLGDFALAVQFHPELTGSMYEDWIEDGAAELAAHGIEASDLLAQRDQHGANMERAATAMLDEWLTNL